MNTAFEIKSLHSYVRKHLTIEQFLGKTVGKSYKIKHIHINPNRKNNNSTGVNARAVNAIWEGNQVCVCACVRACVRVHENIQM